MELVYLWVDNYKNIRNQGFNFSPRFECKFFPEYDNAKLKPNCELEIQPKEYTSIFPNNINITAIVGENGSGKSSILEILFDIYKLFSTRDSSHIDSYLYDLNLKFKNCILIIRKENSFINIGNTKVLNTEVTNFEDTIPNDMKIHSIYYQNNEENIYKQILTHLKELNIPELTFFIPNKIYLDFRGIENNEQGFNEKFIGFYKKEFERIFEKYKEVITKDNNSEFDTVEKFLAEIESNSLQKEWKFISDDEIKKLKALKIIKSKEEEIFSNINLVNNESIYEIKYEDGMDEELLLALSEFGFLDFYDTSKNGFFSDDLIDTFGMNFKGLSSGEKNILKILLYLSQNVQNLENDLTIFLDEPDNTIHPNWQKRLLNNIIKIVCKNTQKRINLIITSHSPFILSDLPKENIIFLEKGVQKKPFKVNEQTFGANIHTLLSDGFFMKDGLMGEFAKEKINDVYKFLTDRESNVKTKEEAQNIINLIGEPLIKRQLEDIYSRKFQIKSKDEIIQELQNKISELEKNQK